MTPITGLALAPPSVPALSVQPAAGGATQPFKNVLIEALNQVNTMQSQASAAVEQLITDESHPTALTWSSQSMHALFRR